MEVSAPVKIIEGHSDVLGITTEVLPGAGECAIITSSSAVNVLSVEKKSVTSTWTFPNNQRESLVCPAYFSSKGENYVCCQGGNSLLQWKNKTQSTKSFKTKELSNNALLLVPVDSFYLLISKSLECIIYSSKLEEIQKETIPAPSKIVKSNVQKINNQVFAVTLMLQYDQRYKVVIIRCDCTSKPQLSIQTGDVPVDSNFDPLDCFYSPSLNSVSFIYSSGSYRQYHIEPASPSYFSLSLIRSMPLVMNDIVSGTKRLHLATPVITWNPCLTDMNGKMFMFVSQGPSNTWLLHFIEAEFFNELAVLSLQKQPTQLVCSDSLLFIIQQSTVLLSQLSVSSLTLGDILKMNNHTPASQHQLKSTSQIVEGNELVKELPSLLMFEKDWKDRVEVNNQSEKEEKEILEIADTHFEQAALSFIDKRLTTNHGILSISSAFIRSFVGRCIFADGEVLTPVIQKLIRAGIDVACNETLLPALLKANDIETLLFYLKFAPHVSEKELVKILEYCLTVKNSHIRTFAKQNNWNEDDKSDRRKKFLQLMIPQVLRRQCDFSILKNELELLSLDVSYNLCLALISMLLHCDLTSPEEQAFFAKHEFSVGESYHENVYKWMNCFFDANLMRIALESKKDNRFVGLLRTLSHLLIKDIKTHRNLLPLQGVIYQIENELPLPVSPIPAYCIERIEF